MRVSNRLMLNAVMRSVATSSEGLLKAQERVATLKLINRPSDDPGGMNTILDFRTKIASIDQYIRNIDVAKTRVETTVSHLETVYDLLTDAKDIAISQSSSDDVSGRETAASQMARIYDQICDITNTRLGGSYLFGGFDTDTLPFPRNEVTTAAESSLNGGEYFNISSSTTDYYVWYDIDNGSTDPAIAGRTGIEVDISTGATADEVAAATQSAIDALADFSASVSGAAVTITTASDGEGVNATDGNTDFDFYNATYNGDSGNIYTIVGERTTVKTNAHGNETFTGSGVTNGVDVLGVLKTLKEALEASTYDPLTIENQVDEFTKAITQVENVTSRQSITFARLEQTETYWGNLKATFENTLSATEDADSAQVAVELQAQETAYEMALAAAATVSNMNILDFLR